MEIASAVIAGGAGLILGNGILFPKTYSRLAAFKHNAKDTSKIVLGIVPIILLADFFESFVTRHTEMPIWLSIGILTGSFIFMVNYVIIYPIKPNKRNHQLNHERESRI